MATIEIEEAPSPSPIPLDPIELFDLVTGCEETEAVLTWAGAAVNFVVGDTGRLAWRLTNRDGSDLTLPTQASIGLYQRDGGVFDMLPVCLEPDNTTDPLLFSDVAWTTGGPYEARLTVAFPDGRQAAATIVVTVHDPEGSTTGSGGNGGNGGTVTSVGLTMPDEFIVSNSPIVDSGVISVSWVTEPGTAFTHDDAEYEHVLEKGVPDGYAPLDENGIVPLENLPPIPTASPDTGNFLLSGGGVVWVSGYTYRVSAASYYIQGRLYTSVEQTITLDAADPALDRIDLLALNTAGTLVKVTGTPSATPSEPDFDPGTQLQLAFVVVEAASSAPTVTTESIYAENTEWATSTSLTGWNPASTNNPRTGSLCIEGTNVAAGAYVQFARPGGTGLDIRARFSVLVFYIRSKAAWASGRSLMVRFQYNGVAQGSTLAIPDGAFGFGSGTTFGYQQIVLPIASFNIPAGILVNQLRIGDNGGPIGLYIDDVFLQQGGLQATTTQFLTITQADARYEQLVRKGQPSGYAPLDTSGKVPLANLPPLGGAGTVTQVGLSAPVEFDVSGSPVTASGTLTFTKHSQSPNLVYAGPQTGAPAAPGFRPLVANDLPVMVGSGSSHAPGIVPDPGAVAGTSKFLREDGTWSTIMASGAPNMANGQVTASNVAGTLIAARSTRRYVTVKNLDSSITVYVGVATVTAANGMPLKAGESVSLDFTGLIQVLAASGSPVVAYAEVYD